MGLDMFLSAKKYISNYDFHPEEKELNKTIKDSFNLSEFKSEQSSVIVTITVVTWRKANQIHDWFVKNVQGGEDNCREYYVSREQLTELLETVEEALKNKDATNLPPSTGCFFGSTKIDDWYWDDLTYTAEQLKKVLGSKSLEKFDFCYQSSW